MKRLLFILSLLLFADVAFGQSPPQAILGITLNGTTYTALTNNLSGGQASPPPQYLLVGKNSDGTYSPCTTAGSCFGGGGGSGTVTNVGAPPFYSVANPTTTPAFSLLTQSANTVNAGPTSGSAAAPTYRALVAADIPAVPASATYVHINGDNICAQAADITVASAAVTGTTSVAGVSCTITTAAASRWANGEYVTLAGLTDTTCNCANGAGNTGTQCQIASGGGTTSLVIDNTSADGNTGATGGTISLGCANQVTDANVFTAFLSNLSIPANTWAAGHFGEYDVKAAIYSPATGTGIFNWQWDYAGSPIATQTSNTSPAVPLVNANAQEDLTVGTRATGLIDVTPFPNQIGNATTTWSSTVLNPVSVTTSSTATLQPMIKFGNTSNAGVKTITYVSGGTPGGTGTCPLNANNGTGANVVASIQIASGAVSPTAFLVTNSGSGYASTSPITSITTWGTCTGSASMTGTATVTSTSGGYTGYAYKVLGITAKIP